MLTAGLLLCTCVRTGDEPDTADFREPSAAAGCDAIYQGSKVGRVSQLTRGPFWPCHSGDLLARRAAGRVSILRRHNTLVGGSDRDTSQHTEGPFQHCHGSDLLTRRSVDRVSILGQDSTAVGGGDGRIAAR